MENITFGILTIGFCLLAYFFSWKYYKKGEFNLAVFLIILSGILIYFYTSADFFLHVWDERYHALVAKNLMNHPLIPTLYENPILPYDYKMWVGNHIWLHKQPLPLWLMAGSMKIFGVNEIALRLPSILLSSLGIFLTYKIGSFFFNKKVGLLAAFLFSINGLIIELTSGRVATDHVDITFMFFILLAIYLTTLFVERKSALYTVLIGVCIGAALLTKWLTGLIVLPIWLLLVVNSNSFNIKKIVAHFSLLVFTIAFVALPWQLYIFKEFPLEAAYEANFNLRHFTEVIEERSGSIFYFIHQIRINYGELIYLPLLWFLWQIIQSPKNLIQLSLAIWFLVPLVIFSLAKTKMQGYLLFAAPALFIITSAFFFELLNYSYSHKPKWLFNLILALFISLPIRYGIERIKPFEKRDRNPKWVVDLKRLNEENIQKGVLFNYENPIEAMYYTDLIVYSSIPSKENIKQLAKEGYLVIINDRDNLRDLEKSLDVRIIKLTTVGNENRE
jgi:4-amino-4-deoxy-L-arabinose transferase-like glycosyltransferase